YRLLQIGACLLLVVAGFLGMVLKDRLPDRWGAYGGLVLVFVAALMATPLIVALLAPTVRPLVHPPLGPGGRLAADNLFRAPGRTGLVIGALAASVGLLVAHAGIIRSNEDAILDWLDHTVTPDLIVSSGGPFTSSGQNIAMEPSVGDAILSELGSGDKHVV